MSTRPLRLLPFAATLLLACKGDGGGSSSGGTGTDSAGSSGSGSAGTSAGTASGSVGSSGGGTASTTGMTGSSSSGSGTASSTGSSSGGSTGGNVPPCPYTPVMGTPAVTVEEVSSGFYSPVFTVGDPQEPSRLLVAEQRGTIQILEGSTILAEPFLDITSQVDDSGDEMGLLGLAFHPNFPADARVYVNYTAGNPRRTVISEFSLTDADHADAGSERVILELGQPQTNHNGGGIAFGPDGYLYIGTGDGGGGCDSAADASRDSAVLLAKMLRIGVEPDGQMDDPSACAGCTALGPFDYTVPADNPFVGDPNYAPEIFALGLRNPWRFAFDSATGALYAGDVGQNDVEEVDVVESGADYGWVLMEGNNCSQDLSCGGPPCDDTASPGGVNSDGLTAPITEYPQSGGACAVIGGSVYHSCEVPAWDGVYYFADYCNGDVRALTWDGSQVNELGVVASIPGLVTGNGWNAWGDVYFTTRGSQVAADGSVYRIVPS